MSDILPVCRTVPECKEYVEKLKRSLERAEKLYAAARKLVDKDSCYEFSSAMYSDDADAFVSAVYEYGDGR